MLNAIGRYVRQHHLALLCLFLILAGGTAWALERNTIKSKHVVDHSLRLKDYAVGHDTRTFDAGELLPNQCAAHDFGGAAFSDVKPGDWTLVIPEGTPSPIDVHGFQTNEAGEAKSAFCNRADSNFDSGPLTIKLIMVR